MTDGDYAETNREAWNQVVPIHQRGRESDLRQEVQRADFNTLGEVERYALARIGLTGKRVAQLCCNNGRELISILKMGAANGMGFDISDAVIEEARELAKLSGTHCDFVRTNVLEIGYDHDAAFDLLVFTVGALCWIKDLRPLFAVAARLLRSGGHLFIYELHPFTDMLAAKDDDEYEAEDELKIVFSYSRDQPWIDSGGLDYIGGTSYDAKTSISFPHSMSETITAIGQSGLVISELREYPHDIANTFAHLEEYGKVPLSYSLLARKLD